MNRNLSSARAPFVVGLTGGIGSGKSTAAEILAACGAFVIDVDDISRSLTGLDGAAVDVIANAFPGAVHEGVVDRPLLRQLVFSDVAKRRSLESILHPLIREQTSKLMEQTAAKEACYVLLVVPLLFESDNYTERVDCAVVVDVDEVDQIARVSASRHIPESTVAKIISAQMPRDARLRRAQFIVDNRGDRASLELQLGALHRVLVANANSARQERELTGLSSSSQTSQAAVA